MTGAPAAPHEADSRAEVLADRRRHRLLLAAAGGAALVLATAVQAADGGPVGADLAVRDLARKAAEPLRLVAEVLAQAGSGAVLYPLLVLLALHRRTTSTAALPLVLAAGQVLETVLLSALPRAAPGFDWAGLSSGRTSAAVLGWGLVAIALGATARRSLLVGCTAGAVVGLTRVVLHAHWSSDVLLALAFGLVLLTTFLLQRHRLPPRPLPASALLDWTRGSPRAWLLTAGAALVAVVPTLLEGADRRMIDLAVYVGSAGVAGAGQDLYAFRTEAGLPFTYPPFAALLAEPLGRVPLVLVQLGWTAATLAAAVAVARVAMAPVVARIGLPVTAALLIVSTPMRSHVRFGQVGIFLVLLVAADLLGRSRRQGWGVGLAAAVKLTPAVFLPWLLVVGARSRLRASVAWAGGATLAGVVLLWPSSPSWLSSALWDSSRFGRNDIPGNQSVRGMLLRTGIGDTAAERWWLVCAVLLLVAGTLGARHLELRGDRLGAVGVLAATSVAVSPISWQHHLVWLTLPLAALVAAQRVRLAVGWAVLMIAPVTTLSTMVDVPVLGALLVNTCGLTAVAAVLLLPALLSRSAAGRATVPG